MSSGWRTSNRKREELAVMNLSSFSSVYCRPPSICFPVPDQSRSYLGVFDGTFFGMKSKA